MLYLHAVLEADLSVDRKVPLRAEIQHREPDCVVDATGQQHFSHTGKVSQTRSGQGSAPSLRVNIATRAGIEKGADDHRGVAEGSEQDRRVLQTVLCVEICAAVNQ